MKRPEILEIDPEAPDFSLLEKAAAALAAGSIVGLPTETVYGVAADAGNPRAMERLALLKERPPGKPFALLLASADDAFRYASSVPPIGHRLMKTFWPGPLTLVLPSRSGGTVGLRVPGMALTREIIRRSGTAAAASSANSAGNPEPLDAESVLRELDGRIDLLVDAGPARIGEASTVVIASGRDYGIARAGAIPSDRIDDLAYLNAIFVCTGNTCRSPMAEGLLKKALASRIGVPIQELPSRGFRIESAGTGSFGGMPASTQAVCAMREIRADISAHVSRPVTPSMIYEADLVLTMTRGHAETVRELSGAGADRVMLVDPQGRNVADPIGGGMEEYRRTRDFLRVAIDARLAQISDSGPRRFAH